MTGYSWAVNERLRRGNLDDRLWAFWADSGHADCEGWTFDAQDLRLRCDCGEVIPLPDGGPPDAS